jgi:hypothetical protein
MSRAFGRWTVVSVGLIALAVGASLGWAQAIKGNSGRSSPEEVELFAAIDAGQLSVKLIPKDSKQCTVMVENKTDRPLTVRLPAAFVGVPVLAQFEGGLDGGGRRGGGYDGGGYGGTQAFGGGWGGGGWGGGGWGGGWGGGAWNIPPQKVATFKLDTVCLEYGKPDPRPQVTYQIKRIEEFTDNKAVHEVVRALAAGVVPQRIAQLAAWHLANGVTWEELASQAYRHPSGVRIPIYSPAELQAAMKLVAIAQERVKDQNRESPGYQSASVK